MGTDGFEFIEYTAQDTAALGRLFEQLGFRAVARHRSKEVTLYRQGDVNFVVNSEPESFAQSFARVHGPSVCAIAIRVADAAEAYERALGLGAKPHQGSVGPMELNIPAIKGIGDSLIYLVDRYGDRSIYDVDFVPLEEAGGESAVGLTYVDHLTHNVYRGRMDLWAGFYERLFNFRELRYFDIEGKLTGLHSRAMTSPCGKIRIPINESADDKSQIEEYLAAYKGEGIQHIALGTGCLRHRRDPVGARRGLHGAAARRLLQGRRHARARPRRGPDAAQAQRHPDRRGADRGRRHPAADLHQDGDRSDLLRDHPTQGRRGLRRRQLPGALRVHGAGPDRPRRPVRQPVIGGAMLSAILSAYELPF
jgi:hypothetical protein